MSILNMALVCNVLAVAHLGIILKWLILEALCLNAQGLSKSAE